jgi:hypothetical protein
MISQETQTNIKSIMPVMLEKAEEGRQARFHKYLLEHLEEFWPDFGKDSYVTRLPLQFFDTTTGQPLSDWDIQDRITSGLLSILQK